MPTPRYVMDPFQEIRRELDEVFQRFMGEGFMPMPVRRLEPGARSPQLDVCFEGDTLRIEAEVPGVEPDNVECALQEGVLIIKGERRRREGEGGIVQERRFGRFERRVTLPEGIDEDSLEASFGKGVLTITAHMKSGAGQERRIPIASTEKSREAEVRQHEPTHADAKAPSEQGRTGTSQVGQGQQQGGKPAKAQGRQAEDQPGQQNASNPQKR